MRHSVCNVLIRVLREREKKTKTKQARHQTHQSDAYYTHEYIYLNALFFHGIVCASIGAHSVQFKWA